MKRLQSSVLALALVAATGSAAPDFVTKEVTGEAAIVNGNKPAAVEEATKKAKRAAVEQVAGVMIESDTLTKDNVLVRDQIYANTAGYIRSFSVVGQPKETAGVMAVTIKAEVGAGQIDKDLASIKAIVKRMGHPKLVLITQEQTIDDKGIITSSSTMQTVLTDAFSKDGWTIIDYNFAAGGVSLGAGVGPAEAKKIGQLSKADYILYGQVKFRRQDPSGMLGPAGKGQQNIFPVTGECDMAFFDTANGSQLTSKSYSMVLPPDKVSQSLLSYERTSFNLAKMKGDEIVKDLRAAVYEFLRNAEMNGARVTMSVAGISEFGVMQQFRKVLAEVSGMREVRKATLESGKASYELSFMGTTDELAEKLDGKTLKGRKLSVTGVTGSSLELSLNK